MSSQYQEPLATFLLLDYLRPLAAKACIESLHKNVKFNKKIIYCHNGRSDYAYRFLDEGLIDELIMPKINGGLGLGTRSLYGACFSRLAIYWQVDQIMGREFTEEELIALDSFLSNADFGDKKCLSISLAGPVCGHNIFSERANIMKSETYHQMERQIPLGAGGAGPWHHLQWREGAIQEYYKKNNYIHFTGWKQLAMDNGRDAVRQNPDGSIWKHEPDRKGLWLVSGPVREKYIYPRLTDQEWDFVIKNQYWPPGRIPSEEIKESFHVWN
jgi:hypothetical protein